MWYLYALIGSTILGLSLGIALHFWEIRQKPVDLAQRSIDRLLDSLREVKRLE